MTADQAIFHYCPFCGQQLSAMPPVFRFCPFCGGNLEQAAQNGKVQLLQQETTGTHTIMPTETAAATPQQDDPEYFAQIETIEDVIHCYEQFIRTRRAEGLPEPQLKAEATALLAKLKQKIHNKIKITTTTRMLSNIADSDGYWEFDYYSVVLKSCPDKERLAFFLDGLLLRGPHAIRMALDRIPSIMIYKSKVEDMVPIIRVFKEQKAGFVVIPGEFSANLVTASAFSEFPRFSHQLQELLQAYPPSLWLGDKILGVFDDAVFEQQRGILVVTNQAGYFLNADVSEIGWTVFPWYLLAAVKPVQDHLQLVGCNHSIGNIYFHDYSKVVHALRTVRQALSEQSFVMYMKISCATCGYVWRQDMEQAYDKEWCETCGQVLRRKLLCKMK